MERDTNKLPEDFEIQIGDTFYVLDPFDNSKVLERTCVGFNADGSVVAKENGHFGWDRSKCLKPKMYGNVKR